MAQIFNFEEFFQKAEEGTTLYIGGRRGGKMQTPKLYLEKLKQLKEELEKLNNDQTDGDDAA